jgi:hypothetical protein
MPRKRPTIRAPAFHPGFGTLSVRFATYGTLTFVAKSADFLAAMLAIGQINHYLT